METHRVILLLLLLAVKAYSQLGDPSLLRIDSGSESSYEDTLYDGGYWENDEHYIKSGTNKLVSTNNFNIVPQLNSLRVFTKGHRSCYILPAPISVRYFMRASFYYGNYDGKFKAPTFGLEFNGNKWVTVETSSTTAQYHEVVHTSRGGNVSVCLVRTEKEEFPFISALEIWSLPVPMYPGMTSDVAWINSYRYNFGAENDNDWILGYPDDTYNRIWQPNNPPGLKRVSADTFLSSCTASSPPDYAMTQAVESPDLSVPINLNFTLPGASNLNYIAMYFTGVNSSLSEENTRYIDVYVNNNFTQTIAPEYGSCSWAWFKVQSTNNLIIQLRANNDSMLPPVISAIEVYTATGVGSSSLYNPNKKKKRLALIIGSSVGLLLLLLGTGTAYLILRRKPV